MSRCYEDGLEFECIECERPFTVALADYEGQWDHTSAGCLCPTCADPPGEPYDASADHAYEQRRERELFDETAP